MVKKINQWFLGLSQNFMKNHRCSFIIYHLVLTLHIHLYNNALVSVSVCSALFEFSAISPCFVIFKYLPCQHTQNPPKADFAIEEKPPKAAFSRVNYNFLKGAALKKDIFFVEKRLILFYSELVKCFQSLGR